MSKLVKKQARKGRGPSLLNRVQKKDTLDEYKKKLSDVINKVLPEDIEIAKSDSESIQTEHISKTPELKPAVTFAKNTSKKPTITTRSKSKNTKKTDGGNSSTLSMNKI